MNDFSHISVLPLAVMDLLDVRPGGVYLDGTIGGGGHSSRILDASAPDGFLIGFDRDTRALERAEKVLGEFAGRYELIHDDFRNFRRHLKDRDLDGVLLDLGVSSFQLDDPEAGFSFRSDGPLDMRMDQTRPATAATLVNTLDAGELARIFWKYGEEKFSKKIANAIVGARKAEEFTTTARLAETIRAAVPKNPRIKDRIDPATRTFQALRIAVNDELSGLDVAIEQFAGALKPGGRLVVISFHSLEDRIVKWAFRKLAGKQPDDRPAALRVEEKPIVEILTRKPVLPDADEQDNNPRSRSAKLRAVVKL